MPHLLAIDDGEACGCGAMPEHARAIAYVDAVAAAKVPVVVVSTSARPNRLALINALVAREVYTTILPASNPDPELRWLGWLWSLGALDHDPKE